MDIRRIRIIILASAVVILYVCLAFWYCDSKPDDIQQVSQNVAPAPTAAAYGLVSDSSPVEPSFFDNSVFVGDSVSVKLQYYAAATGDLGNAKFLAAGSLGSGNALHDVGDDTCLPTWDGVEMHLEDSIPKTGANKLYIMLGMNDIGLYGVDKSIENYMLLLSKIKSNCPDIVVFVQSMTPTTSTSNVITDDGINTNTIKDYNKKLLSACQKNGYYFLDVASVMYDQSNNFLRSDYCSDNDGMGMHFSDIGCKAWVQYLYTHTTE